MFPNITIELRHIKDKTYESRILNPDKQDILRKEFTLSDDDSFFVTGTRYLEGDAKRDPAHIDSGFIKRFGNHFYHLITGSETTFREYLRLEKSLKKGYSITLELDTKQDTVKPEIKEGDGSGDTLFQKLVEIVKERLKEKPEGIQRLSEGADLLWQVPWGELKDKDLSQFFSILFDHNWHSTFFFTSRCQWQLLSPHPDKPHALSCGLPVENYLCIQLPPLTPHQTVQHMNNLAGPLSKLTIADQKKLLTLVQGHPKTIELLDSYLHTHTLDQVLGDQHLKGKVIEEIGTYFMDGLWQDLDKVEQETLENLAIFRTPLTEQDITALVPGKTPLAACRTFRLGENSQSGNSY